MKLSSVNRALWASLLALACLPLLSFVPLSKVDAANATAAILPSAGKPLVRLRSPQVLRFEYAGSPDAVAALGSGRATPTALAEADFDADGAPDVVAGYATSDGGVLTLLRGNPDAYAPKDTSLYQKAMRGDVPATFLPSGVVYAIPESPDLILTGDFNRDGHQDVLVAARGGELYLLAGDGKGNLGAPQAISVAGRVWAMAATGDGHVAVSTEGEQGPEVRILAPGSAGLSVSAKYPLPAQGDAVVWGPLGGSNDLAVGAGSHIAIVYNPLMEDAQTETVNLPFTVKGLALGDFIWDRDGRTEMAALAGDGTISILQHGTLDSRALTAADLPGRRAARMARATQPIDPTSLGAWNVAKKLPYAGSAPAGPVGPSAFSSPGLAAAATSDLMVLDGQRGQLNILDTSGRAASPSAGVSVSRTPVAALALPQKINAGRDTVLLTAGETNFVLITSNADPTFNVNTTADEDTAGACTNSSITSAPATLSLREAICVANNNAPATSVINVPAGTYSLTSLETGELQIETSGTGYTLSIIGTGSTPGDTIIQQTDTVDRIIEEDFAVAGSNPLTIQNVTLTGGACSNVTTNDCYSGGGAVLAGAYPGDNLTLTSVVMTNNSAEDVTSGGELGGAVQFDGPTLTISGATFSTNSTPTGSGGAGGQGGAIYFDSGPGYPPGNLSITNSTFTGNIANPLSGAPDTYGGAAFVVLSSGNTATVTGSTFTGNSAKGTGEGGAIYITGPMTASDSRFVGNTATSGGAILEFNSGAATVTDNWWGCNAGPGASGCDVVTAMNTGTVSYNPWLVLSIGGNPTTVDVNGTSTLTAGITTNSNSGTGYNVPDGTAITFGGTLGTASPTGTNLTSGQATSTFTAGSTPGTGSGTATVDNQTVSATIDIVDSPTITSASSTTFTVGAAGSFTVTASGSPAPTFSETGLLPSGVTLSSGGVLSGTPAAGTGGAYVITITASNGVSPNAMQTFTLTVNIPQVQLTITANPAAGGTVTPASGSVYNLGTVVPITATANSGYAFLHWTSSPDAVASSTSASTTIPMNAAEAVTAQFSANLVVNLTTDDAGVATNCVPQASPGVTSTSDSCTLRDALAFAANAGAASITFDSTVFTTPQTITLGSAGTLTIPANATISGPTRGSGGALTNLVTVNGGGASNNAPVFTGSATAGGSSILNLIITNGSVSGPSGGGIYNAPSSILTVINCTVAGNTAPNGSGGIYNDDATMTVTNSTISGNNGAAGGLTSGINGSLAVVGTTISGNVGTQDGGGLYLGQTTVSVTNSTISGNTSGVAGGGIDSPGSTVNLANTIVTGNSAPTNPDISGGYTDNGGNHVATGVALTPLGNYGGPTQTMLPLPGDPSLCGGLTVNAVLTTDQRGSDFDPRCPAGAVDSGAVQTNYALRFTVQPHQVFVGQPITPAPAVTLYESGAVAANASTAVTLSDTGVTLNGTLTQDLAAGTATFPNLTINTPVVNTAMTATMALTSSVNLTAQAWSGLNVAPALSTLITPAPGSGTLIGPQVTFSWTASTGATAYSLWVGTTGPGSNNVYDLYTSATSATVATLPTPVNGETLYVRLYTHFNTIAEYNDYTFTASQPATLATPTPNTTLTGPDATFSWNPATGPGSYPPGYTLGYSLWLGSGGAGTHDLYDSGWTASTTVTAYGLPTNGAPIYARLNTIYNNRSVSIDYVYTAATLPQAALTTPAPGTQLSGAKVTFSWSPAYEASGYALWIGSTGPGSHNLLSYAGGSTATSATATRLPTNGETLYVRLYTRYNTTWQYTDYIYTAAP